MVTVTGYKVFAVGNRLKCSKEMGEVGAAVESAVVRFWSVIR